MNVTAGGHTQPALQSSRKIGDDISKHIIGNHDVELPGIADHLHAERVHIHVLSFDLGIFAAYVFEHPLPEAARVGHSIRLVAHEHTVAGRAVQFGVTFAVFESVADDALDSLACVYIFLHGNFIGRTFLEDSAGIGVNAFRIFADHDEV